jgi:hypothetical protein
LPSLRQAHFTDLIFRALHFRALHLRTFNVAQGFCQKTNILLLNPSR